MKKEGKYKHGLKVPKDYFEDFEERLFDQLSLESLPKKTGFEVPEGYFDTLEEQILQKVDAKTDVKVIPLYKRKAFLYVSSIAACLILVFSIFSKGSVDSYSFELAEIEAFINEEGMDYDSYDLAQLMTEEELESLPVNDLLSEENLENYLLENLDDTSLLIE